MKEVQAFVLNCAVLSQKAARLNSENSASLVDRADIFTDPLISPYIPQVDVAVRRAAQEMSIYYELFHALENHLRQLTTDLLEDRHGEEWWDVAVSAAVRENAAKNLENEIKAGVTRRSDRMIDYTNFGELGVIVRENWETFVQIFNSREGFNRVMNSLNILRATIAHCSAFSEDEVLRLKLTFRDLFRLME